VRGIVLERQEVAGSDNQSRRDANHVRDQRDGSPVRAGGPQRTLQTGSWQ
jgi:hypothetical protein